MRRPLALLALMTPVQALADELALSGTSRLRYETIAGQPRAGFGKDDTFINLRSTLALEYRAGPWLLSGELWDSRVWNADPDSPLTTGEVNTFEPVQAFVRYDAGAALGHGSKLAVQAGRFTLNLGSRRLVAADDYRNTTNGYTGVRVDVGARGGIDATLIYVLPQIRRPDDAAALFDNASKLDRESRDLVLWGGVAAKRAAIGPATAELSYFRLTERDAPGRPTRDRQLNTVAARIIRDAKAGAWDYEVEAIRQTGQVSDGLAASARRRAVSAWFVHVDAG